jgi:pimeloyl-ACP methyl ester carboxylesterase
MRFHSALLLHGAGGGGWEWNVWRAMFEADGMQVHAPDLQPVAAGMGATCLSDYVTQASRALGALPRPRVLVGASLGGLLAAQLAAQGDVARIEALVLVNPLPPAPWHRQLLPREWPDVVLWARDARLASTCSALPDADATTALFAFRHWRDESGAALREAYAGVVVERPRCPVLCVVSGADADVPPEATRALARDWGATLHEVGHAASHVGPLLGGAAAQTAQQVLAWLRSAPAAWA